MKKKEFVAQDLLSKIYQQTENATPKLPTERELAKEYDVSRYTIRKALEKLSSIGIIDIIQGSGIFINEKVKNSPLIYNSITEKKYSQITSRLVYFRKRLPNKEEQLTFDISDNEFIWDFRRIRLINDRRIQIETSKLPACYFADLNRKVIESSIQKYVLSKGWEISHYLTNYQAISISKEQAQLLECRKGLPAMKITNRGFLSTGVIYEVSEVIDIDYSCTYIIPFNKANLVFRQS